MTPLVIFSQSPADLQYVLGVVSDSSAKRIEIVVVNVFNNYKYLKSLGLKNVRLRYISEPALKYPWNWVIQFFRLRFIYRNYFHSIKGCDLYFFADYYDYVTPFFIARLIQNNRVFFCNIYPADRTAEKKLRLSERIRYIVLYLITGVRFDFIKLGELKPYRFPVEKYKIEIIDIAIDRSKIEPYLYHLPASNYVGSKRPVLIFEAGGADRFYQNYEKTMTEVLDRLGEKYLICIKPHPRRGYSHFIDRYNPVIIDDSIPGELLEYKQFLMVLGVETVSVAYAALYGVDRAYSLIELFEPVQPDWKKSIIAYLNTVSREQTRYINDLKELEKL